MLGDRGSQLTHQGAGGMTPGPRPVSGSSESLQQVSHRESHLVGSPQARRSLQLPRYLRATTASLDSQVGRGASRPGPANYLQLSHREEGVSPGG